MKERGNVTSYVTEGTIRLFKSRTPRWNFMHMMVSAAIIHYATRIRQFMNVDEIRNGFIVAPFPATSAIGS